MRHGEKLLRAIDVRLHPSDRLVLALLALAVAVAAVRFTAAGPLLLGHVGMFAAFAVVSIFMARHERWPAVAPLRSIATATIILTCYTTLGRLGVEAMPYDSDAALSALDNELLGFDPALALEPYQTPGWVEFYSFIYAAFIPYIYLSLLLNCLGRPAGQRDEFLTGWVITYTVSYLGYLFVPAHGPVVYQAHDFSVPLSGGFFYGTVVAAVASTGGLQGVFPSLHVGGSVFWCLYDLRINRLRGLTYLPIVLLIYVATLFLRYHYVVDLIAGTLIAAVSIPLGQYVFRRWSQRRVSSGLCPFPGDVRDDL